MKVVEILKLTRIEHSAMLVIAVLAAELLTGGLPSAQALALSIITPIFISMGAFAINDYFDIEVDRANKKNRPLVRGTLSPNEALYIALASILIGVIASYFINYNAFYIALFFGAMSLLYSYRLKELVLVGNAYIALSMVIPFVYGNFISGTLLSPTIVIISAIVFCAGLAREIHGTIRDYGGDTKMRNAVTLPRVIGIRSSAVASLLLYLVSIVLSMQLFLYVLPYAYNPVYGIMVGITDVLLLYVGIGYVIKNRQAFYDKTRNVSLVAMGLALLAFLFAQLA